MEGDTRLDGSEQDGLHEDAWEQELQIVAGRTRDGTAEQVGEHHQEQNGSDCHVHQLLRNVAAVMTNLDASSRDEAVAKAVDQGLLSV